MLNLLYAGVYVGFNDATVQLGEAAGMRPVCYGISGATTLGPDTVSVVVTFVDSTATRKKHQYCSQFCIYIYIYSCAFSSVIRV